MTSLRGLIKPPDYVTLLSTACGLLSIFSSVSEWFEIAALLMLAAVLFDRLDGKVARILRLEDREFGKELDSLSDVLSFGAAPAVFGFALGLKSWYEMAILILFVCAGVLRLARFMVVKTEKGYYQGMNITYNGLIFPIFYFGLRFFVSKIWQNKILLVAYLVSGGLMLSSIKWKKI